MTMVEAYTAYGTQLQIGDGATPTEVFTTIPGVRDISGPAIARATEEVTAHSSPGGFRAYVSTLRDGGEITCDINWTFDPAQEALETALYDNDQPVNFKLVFPTPDADTANFAGFVNGLEWSEPVEGALTRSLTIQVTGPVTMTSTPAP